MDQHKGNEKLLLFEMQPERKKVLKSIAEQLNMKTVEVLPREYNQQIGCLSGIIGFKRAAGKYKGEPLGKEIVVFSGISSERMDQVLDAWKASGLAKIELKAAVTPVNAFWTPVQLMKEIHQEHQAMSR